LANKDLYNSNMTIYRSP